MQCNVCVNLRSEKRWVTVVFFSHTNFSDNTKNETLRDRVLLIHLHDSNYSNIKQNSHNHIYTSMRCTGEQMVVGINADDNNSTTTPVLLNDETPQREMRRIVLTTKYTNEKKMIVE